MKDYVGLEASEVATLKAMADYSFHSALGNMDEAFRAIKLIKRYIHVLDCCIYWVWVSFHLS